MIGVGAQRGPDAKQNRKRRDNRSREDERNDLRGRLRVGLEDVVDLRLGSVSEGRVGDGERHIGVAGDCEVENLALVRRRRAERADDDRGGDRFRRCEELVGEVLVRLGKSALSIIHCRAHIPNRPCPCHSPSH
jgi:hypothetical protein